MRLEQAEEALVPLIITGSGWSDESVEFYGEQLAKLPDAELLKAACLAVSLSWRSTRRPPLAEILEAYRMEVRRAEAMNPPMLPPVSGRIVSSADGKKLAAQAYMDEARLHGKAPNWPLFERIFGSLTERVNG